ncbi:polyphosphate polymerase domain-containing protein [Actinomyces gaoshouyii]|uniref:VTC domain-containing protein n=1 Tax=Actinomyces gaoshouyii TaxID=1960083 RepID=A0A8H9LHV2_9ACTO|nr:polyphosphate polymerase domain-containing protein [Actinomyces gaoshouyii]GGO95220.1 VTC domain-containing protein [Actinomyces gaoshouyii]
MTAATTTDTSLSPSTTPLPPVARTLTGHLTAAATRPALSTRALDAISLDELNATAGLLTRMDRKYLVPIEAAQGLLDALASGIAGRSRALEIKGQRSFAYASTYFDTPDLAAYHLAARKRRRRFKVRTRSYLDSDLCFLEVKTRGPRGATIKERIPWALDDADRLTPEGRAFIAALLFGSGVCRARDGAERIAAALTPVMGTTYERTTLHLPQAEARATIDTRLVWMPMRASRHSATGATRGAGRPAGPQAIIETKSPGTPSPADRFLWSLGHRPAKISKYATGLALLERDLPANKWHRVITNDLAGAARPPEAQAHD